jgi:hypothetical protein
MKLDKSTLKSLIKESIEEMSLNVPMEPQAEQLPLVTRVDSEMIKAAILGEEDYLISRKFAAKILGKHHVDNLDEAFAELGDSDTYKVSELFGWLGY